MSALNHLRKGQTVWITGGLDKGKKGTVDILGFGQVSVKLDSETKVFSQSSVTTKDPNSIPLPPNFLPLDFKVGDKVEVTGHRNDSFNGITGTVIGLPSAITRTGDLTDNRYKIRISECLKIKGYSAGDRLWFAPENLKTAAPAQRVEGTEIAHEDVKLGDTIRVTIERRTGDYSQTSTREGKVTSIINTKDSTDPKSFWFHGRAGQSTMTLNYQHENEKITLIKKGESPNVAIVKELAAGSVIVRESIVNSSVSTFVKSQNWHSASQWHVMNSLSSKSSTFVTDSDIVRVLDEGAKIVHTVKKVRIPPPPQF